MIRHLACAALLALAPVSYAPPRYYLALGDSIAYGFQAGKALAGLPPAAFDTGFVDVLSARLPRLRTVNYACPGESTVTFVVSCPWKDSGHRLHDDYRGAQLSAALAFLRHHRTELITVSLNGNDITDFVRSCNGDPACIGREAPAAVARYATRLREILNRLRAAAPAAQIVVVGAYNPNVTDRAFSDPLFASVNAAQADAAAAVRARFADPSPVFDSSALCTLTLVCTKGDTHPSDAGYRALADVVWRTVRPAQGRPHGLQREDVS
jgi:lysophospholipase L1-like esterase